MKKLNQNEQAPVPVSFYRPHVRVQYSGELLNHATGEFYIPPRRVKQSFVAECDINTILKQYSQTGQIRHMNAKAAMGTYADLPDDVDFQTSLHTVQAAQAAFATLPSKVRDRFANDPARFLEFMADASNAEEAAKLGLLSQPKETPPAPPPPSAPESNDPETK